MAIDFSQYVFKPRPLQQFDIGQGFRDVIEARFGRDRIDNQKAQAEAQQAEQTAGRQDMNTRFSATIASDRNTAGHEAQMKRNQQAVLLVAAARKAANTGDWNTADALGPRILEMGGRYTKRAGPGGQPVYEFQAPGAPEQGGVDYAGTREQIFGGGGNDPGAVGAGSPFQMRSNVGPGGPGAGGNPFERLPGASAAALPPQAPQAPAPPQASPQPPPAAAPQGPGIPGEAAAAASADGQAAIAELEAAVNGGAPQAAPQAPMPPADPQAPPNLRLSDPAQASNPFNPYQVDTSQVQAQNQLRLQPYFEGTAGGFPERYRGRVEALNQGAQSLNLPPEKTLKLWQPTLNTIAGQMKAEQMATVSGERLSLAQENSANTRNRLLEDRTTRNTLAIANSEELKVAKRRVREADNALSLLAMNNSHGDIQAITMLRNMYEGGVMTDEDFTRAKRGLKTVFEQMRAGVTESVISSGMNPDTRREMSELFRKATSKQRGYIQDTMEQMMVEVRQAGSEEERRAALKAIQGHIPRSLWNDEVKEAFGEPVPQKTGRVDAAGNVQIGPASPKGKLSASASATRSKRGEKSLDDYTEEELNKLPTEELERLLDKVK
jgi:hypothetical protein